MYFVAAKIADGIQHPIGTGYGAAATLKRQSPDAGA